MAPRSFTQVKAKRAQSIEFGRYSIQLGFGLRADQHPTDPGQPDAEVESRRPGILLIEKNQVCAQVHRQSQSLRFTRAELLTKRQGEMPILHLVFDDPIRSRDFPCPRPSLLVGVQLRKYGLGNMDFPMQPFQ